jgi:hypothetical protein
MTRYLSPLLLLSILLYAPAVIAQNPTKDAKPAKAPSDKELPNLPRDPTTNKVTYTSVIEAPGATQEQLYQRAQTWLARNNRGPEGVAPVEDKINSGITAQGQLTLPMHIGMTPYNALVNYTLLIYTKEGKAKYEFTNFTDASFGPFEVDEPQVKVAMGNGMLQRAWNRTRNLTDAEIRKLAASLELGMKSQTKAPTDF